MVIEYAEAFDEVMIELDRATKAFTDVQGDPLERSIGGVKV